MPFTFAHAAIALPFVNRRVSTDFTTGLVLGTLTPDFEYFLSLAMVGGIGHTIAGVFLFCLPTGLLLGILWHFVVKVPLIDNLPCRLFSRFAYLRSVAPETVRSWIFYSCGVILGAVSHLVWDSFTHRTGFWVQRVTWLSNHLFLDIATYKYLQHLSTFVGLTSIVVFIVRLPTTTGFRPDRKNWFFWPSVATGLILGYGTIQCLDHLPYSASKIGYHAVRMISASMASLVISCAIFRWHCS